MTGQFKGQPYPRELYQSPIYRSWTDMKTRCNNPLWKQYADYGGRGIKVCERWDSFALFLEDMHSTYHEGLTLDRVDCDGDYSPENCRWATRREQNNNKRNNNKITFMGESHTLNEWSRIRGLRPGTVRQRFYVYGWSIERCLTEGVRR